MRRLLSHAALAVFLALTCVIARAEDPPLPGLPNERAVKAFELGERLLRSGKPEDAARAFDEAAKLAPTFHLAHYAAGNALATAGKTREAEKRYRESVAVYPDFAPGWNALGVVLLSSDRVNEAVEAFDRSLRADPEHALARLHRGEAHVRSGHPKKGEEDARGVLRTDPKNGDARVVLATALSAQGRSDEAHATVDELLAAEPAHGAGLLFRATLFAREDELDKAARALGDAVRLAGDRSAVRNQAARLAAAIAEQARTRGEAPAQVAALDTLSTLAPRSAGVWARLGAALITLYETRPTESRDRRELDRACKALETSLELDPDQPPVKQLLDMYRDK